MVAVELIYVGGMSLTAEEACCNMMFITLCRKESLEKVAPSRVDKPNFVTSVN